MSTVQTLEMYKILKKYFQNEEDATKVVVDLQFVIDKKFEEKKTEMPTKQDITELKLELKDLRAELFNKMNDLFKWTIATMIAVAGIIIAIIKLM